jgi:type I restriction enzyme S subunit
MTSEWNHFALGEITELVIDYRGKTPKKLGGDWCKQGYRALSAKNIKTGRIVQAETIRYIDESLYRKWMKDEVQRGDILITSEAPFGQIFFWDSDEKIVLSQRLFCVRIKPEYDARFIYYYMTTPEFQSELDGRATGTTVIGLRQPELMKCVIRCPEIQEQKVIAAILSSIDAKIIANEKVNDNLQQQAQAIYSSMFIDNPDPAWSHGHLSDLITVKYGKDHKKLADGIYPVYGSGGIMRYVERPLYNKESVLIPRKGTLNNVMYVNQPFWSVDTMFYTEMKLPNVAKFVYHFVKAKDLASMNAGSAVPSMTTDILNAMEVVIPSASALEEFESLVAPMYEAMEANDVQSKALSQMRDTLLPKLMSGEIDVSDIQL